MPIHFLCRVGQCVIAAMAACGFAFGADGAAVQPLPNILFIYADDLGFGDLAVHGHPTIKTPHLDRLAREGTDFWSFTVVNPVCSPSRTGIMTGQFPSRWGVHQHFASHQQNVARNMPDWLDPRAPLMSRILKQAGYRTAHYGKWHLSGGGIGDAPLPSEYGFDDAAVWTGPGRHVFDSTEYSFGDLPGAAHDREAASWISVAATDHAIQFIRNAGDEPFYVNLWLHETHHLVSATEEDKAVYPNVSEPHRTYYAAVSRADRQVGRLLELLDELQVADRTLVIFSSDNGPENTHPEPGQKFYYSVGSTGGLRGRKRSLLLGGVNTPLLVRWPGVVPAGRVDKQTAIAGVDILPTVLDGIGIQPPEKYVSDGESVLAAFRGSHFERSKPVFWYWQGKHSGDDWPAFAMREKAWMLLLDETKKRAELYNLVADRSQAKNLADQYPQRTESMRRAIETWFAKLPTSIDPSLQSREGEDVTSRAAPAKPNRNRGPDRARAFRRWDKNGNGVLTLDEYTDGLTNKTNAQQRFKRFDEDGDGSLTRAEFVGE